MRSFEPLSRPRRSGRHARSSLMLPLIIAILLLYVGPVLGAAVQRRPRLLHALDGFVLVAIGGLCLLHLLPEAFTVLGFPALLI